MLYTGDFVSAAEAERIGLYNRVVAGRGTGERDASFCGNVGSRTSFRLGKTKEMLNREFHMDFEAALESEAQAQAICMQHPDYREAYEAFVAKRAHQNLN